MPTARTLPVWRAAARAGAVVALAATAGVTLTRMRRELDEGRFSRATAVTLDSLYVAHLAAVAWTGARDGRWRAVPGRLAVAAGASVAAAGVALVTAGMSKFGSMDELNAVADGDLVVDGIYRCSRHPQYVGWTGVLAGVAIALRSPRAVAVAAAYPAAVAWWVPREERHLIRRFGDDYRRYQRSVPRWLGGPSDPGNQGATT
jgi:protein-S-isoprenylcysteine O-methyltransferase Ste14